MVPGEEWIYLNNDSGEKSRSRGIIMDIPLTKEQYSDLIKIVYLGEWIVNSYRVEEDDMKFTEIEKYIYSFAKEAGLDNVLEHNEELNEFLPTAAFEEENISLTEEYDYEAFWEILIEELAKKDLIQNFSETELVEMDGVKKIMELEKYRERYENEFEKNGVTNLTLKDE